MDSPVFSWFPLGSIWKKRCGFHILKALGAGAPGLRLAHWNHWLARQLPAMVLSLFCLQCVNLVSFLDSGTFSGGASWLIQSEPDFCDIRDGPQRSDWDTHLALARLVCGAALLTVRTACGGRHWTSSLSQDTETKGGSGKPNPNHTLKKENLGPNPSGYFPASLSETSSSFPSRTEGSRLLFCSYVTSFLFLTPAKA